MTTTSPTSDQDATPLTRRRWARLVVFLVVAAVAGVVLWRVVGQSPQAPYDDPQAAGLLTLCSADGEPVTGGRVGDHPFAAAVVGSTGLPEDVDPAGAVGTLFAYQPREGVSAAEFSGTPLTAAEPLADPATPAVTVGDDVWSVDDFTTAYPATYDGYVQLRLYLGTPEAGTLTETPYDIADLRVTGDTWELVRGGTASCADATASTP